MQAICCSRPPSYGSLFTVSGSWVVLLSNSQPAGQSPEAVADVRVAIHVCESHTTIPCISIRLPQVCIAASCFGFSSGRAHPGVVAHSSPSDLSAHQISRNSTLSSLTSPSLSRAAHHFGIYGPSIRAYVFGLHSHIMAARWIPSLSAELLQELRGPGPGGGCRWELRIFARSLSSASTRGPSRGSLHNLHPVSHVEDYISQGPLRGFVVTLSLIASPPTCIDFFCLSLSAYSTTDPAAHVSREFQPQWTGPVGARCCETLVLRLCRVSCVWACAALSQKSVPRAGSTGLGGREKLRE